MGAVLAPDRLALPQNDVVGGTSPDALAAAGAGITGGEGPRLDADGVENGVHRPAHEAVVEVIAGGGEGLSGADGSDGAVDVRLRPGHDAAGLLRLGHAEHGNVVLRHHQLGRAHAGQALFSAELAVIVVGAADLAAAGHDEPRLLCAGELRAQQPVPHQTGDAPGVGGGDDDQTLTRFNGRGVAAPDAVIQGQQGVAQRVRHALGRVAAVAGAGKVQDHVCPSLRYFPVLYQRRGGCARGLYGRYPAASCVSSSNIAVIAA